MNLNQGQITKRPVRAITRLMKVNGSMRAESLGSVVESGTAGFRRKTACRFTHSFLQGTDGRVCSICGFYEPLAVSKPAPLRQVDFPMTPELAALAKACAPQLGKFK